MIEINPFRKRQGSERFLHHWLEKRRIFDAVAVYGGHMGILDHLQEFGKLPAVTESDLPYQKEILEKYTYLYFCLPLMNKLRQVSPDLEQAVLARFSHQPDKNNLLQTTLSRKQMIQTATGYAIEQAVQRKFTSILDLDGWFVDTAEIHQLAVELLPYREVETFYKTPNLVKNGAPTIDDIEYICNMDIVRAIMATFDTELLIRALNQSLNGQYALLYFNAHIFKTHAIEPCFESDEELVIIGNEPLTSQALAGVQIIDFGTKAK